MNDDFIGYRICDKKGVLIERKCSKIFVLKDIVEDLIDILGYTYIYKESPSESKDRNIQLKILNETTGMFIDKEVYNLLIKDAGAVKDINISESEKEDIYKMSLLNLLPSYYIKKAKEHVLLLREDKFRLDETIEGVLESKNNSFYKEIHRNIYLFDTVYIKDIENIKEEILLSNKMIKSMSENNLMLRKNVRTNDECTSSLLKDIATVVVERIIADEDEY